MAHVSTPTGLRRGLDSLGELRLAYRVAELWWGGAGVCTFGVGGGVWFDISLIKTSEERIGSIRGDLVSIKNREPDTAFEDRVYGKSSKGTSEREWKNIRTLSGFKGVSLLGGLHHRWGRKAVSAWLGRLPLRRQRGFWRLEGKLRA